MAAYSLTSDLAADQATALDNSAKLVKDGTRLTGNVQSAIARFTSDPYANTDVVTVKIGTLPAGVRILPAFVSFLRTSGGTYTWVLKETTNDTTLASGAAGTTVPALVADFDHQKATAPLDLELVLTLGASLPASFTGEITVLYSAAA